MFCFHLENRWLAGFHRYGWCIPGQKPPYAVSFFLCFVVYSPDAKIYHVFASLFSTSFEMDFKFGLQKLCFNVLSHLHISNISI